MSLWFDLSRRIDRRESAKAEQQVKEVAGQRSPHRSAARRGWDWYQGYPTK